MAAKHTDSTRLTLLFTCVGRRIELMQAFRAAARRLEIQLHIIGTDTSPLAPAVACVDEAVLVPRIADPAYLPTLLRLAKERNAHALIPTIDSDLLILSQNREAFDGLGCTALVCEPSAIQACSDKLATYELLHNGGVDTPRTWTADQIRATSEHRFPYFVKPRFGSAGVATRKAQDAADLDYCLRRTEEPIVQEFVEGAEHTLDVYLGLTGQVRCVVPRRRLMIRCGEVSRGVTNKDPHIMAAGKKVAELLGPSARGVVTVQCIVTPEHRIRFIEINPRFGGGAPLGIRAGADFPGWLMQELLGRTPQIEFDGFAHGLCMSRYDWSAFFQLDDDLKPKLGPSLTDYPSF
jgi:carbamoyl-phosphate synthase large subunit